MPLLAFVRLLMWAVVAAVAAFDVIAVLLCLALHSHHTYFLFVRVGLASPRHKQTGVVRAIKTMPKVGTAEQIFTHLLLSKGLVRDVWDRDRFLSAVCLSSCFLPRMARVR